MAFPYRYPFTYYSSSAQPITSVTTTAKPFIDPLHKIKTDGRWVPFAPDTFRGRITPKK